MVPGHLQFFSAQNAERCVTTQEDMSEGASLAERCSFVRGGWEAETAATGKLRGAWIATRMQPHSLVGLVCRDEYALPNSCNSLTSACRNSSNLKATVQPR